MCETDRGQSELLGFLLIFVAVVLTIALVSATGFVAYDNATEYQRTANAEQAVATLANDVDDVTGGGAPSRATEIGIADASLSIETNETDFALEVDGEELDLEGENTTGSIVYDAGGGTTIAYRSGAVLRQDDGNSVMLRDPDFVVSNETVVLSIDRITGPDSGPVGGTSAVDVRTRDAGTIVVAEDEAVDDNVTIELSTPHADAWSRYFEQFEDEGPVTDVGDDGNTVEVTIETERLYVTVNRVDVTFG